MSSASGLCNTGDHPLPPGTTKEVPRFFFLMRRTVTIPNLDGLYLPLLDKGIVWLSNLKKEDYKHWSFPRWCSGKESTCQWGRHRRFQFNPWIGKISWRRKYPPMLVLFFFFFWKIPWTEEPGGLQFMGLQRIGHNWASANKHLLWGILLSINIGIRWLLRGLP